MRRLLLALAVATLLGAQGPAPAELLQQAKALWTTQGDREGAAAKVEQAVSLLSALRSTLDPAGRLQLCDALNWLAVLDDRASAQKPRVPQHFQAILDLDPDFTLDRAVTPARLQAAFETARDARFPKVELALQPEGGVLEVDGAPAPPSLKRLPAGPHRFAYRKPGYAPQDRALEAKPGVPLRVQMDLTRTASTLRVEVKPKGAELFLDGQVLARASEGPVVLELLPGAHRLELRAPCHRTRTIALPESFTAPLADHVLEPLALESNAARLSLSSSWKGGEAYLDGALVGPLPLKQHPVCEGSHRLEVLFPSGGYAKILEVAPSRDLDLKIEPRPRLAFLGLEGAGDFPGKARLEAGLQALPTLLAGILVLPPRSGEAPAEALARLQRDRGAELVLAARALAEGGVTLVELRLSTLDGLEERRVVKPLDQDPLGPFLRRLTALPPLWQAGIGVLCLDVPGEPGPWVLEMGEEARKAGLQPHLPLVSVGGQAVGSVRNLKALLAKAPEGFVEVGQGGRTLRLPLTPERLELPLQDDGVSYPSVVAELRLRILGTSNPEQGHLKLNLGRAYLHFGKPDRALEVFREAALPAGPGVSQGTLAYLTGLCLLRLGPVYIPEAIQAFTQALQSPGSTLLGPQGPPVAPLAQSTLHSLQP